MPQQEEQNGKLSLIFLFQHLSKFSNIPNYYQHMRISSMNHPHKITPVLPLSEKLPKPRHFLQKSLLCWKLIDFWKKPSKYYMDVYIGLCWTSNINPRREMPNNRPLSTCKGENTRYLSWKLVSPHIFAWVKNLNFEFNNYFINKGQTYDNHSFTSISPFSLPTAMNSLFKSVAILLIGDGIQSENLYLWTIGDWDIWFLCIWQFATHPFNKNGTVMYNIDIRQLPYCHDRDFI